MKIMTKYVFNIACTRKGNRKEQMDLKPSTVLNIK